MMARNNRDPSPRAVMIFDRLFHNMDVVEAMTNETLARELLERLAADISIQRLEYALLLEVANRLDPTLFSEDD